MTLHTWRLPEIATIWINNNVNKGVICRSVAGVLDCR